jgi:hypothetical protein
MVDGLLFIIETIQGKKKVPVKYRHFIKIPVFLYDELVNHDIIIPENYYIEQAAFFEINEFFVTISFINYTHVEDMHVRILSYLLVKSMGDNPIERGCHSRS